MLNLSYEKLITPRAISSQKQRQEYILNVLLLGVIALILGLSIVVFVNYLIYSGEHEGINPYELVSTSLPFILLLFLSRAGHSSVAAYLFIALLVLLSTYPLAVWSILLPQALLMYGLIVVMSGILLGTRVSFVVTATLAIALFVIVALGNYRLLSFDRTWTIESGGYNDAVSYSACLACIALVSWLFNKEISSSLVKAQAAERRLRKARDSLEIKVRERTKALEKAQAEKTLELHRFAEFGRLSSALLHELASPLTAVLLNLEMLEESKQAQFLTQARQGLDHIEQYVMAARRQLRKESEITTFDVGTELKRVIELLRPQATVSHVKIYLSVDKGIKLKGDCVRFSQIVANLIMNAIDSYQENQLHKNFGVKVSAQQQASNIRVSVQDKGVGISSEVINHIFEPFFTTKSTHRGTGIGLTITKQAIEEDFHGRIRVTSNKSSGTKFTVLFPLQKKVG